jgi:membrane-associated phospholipid phosphatase
MPGRHKRRRLLWLVLGVLLPLALCLMLAEDVAEQPLRSWDRAVLRAVEHLHGAVLTDIMRALTFFGGVVGGTVLAAALVVALVVLHRRRDALFVAAAVAGAGVLQYVAKLAFARPRPAVFPPLVAVTTTSYPSGHAMASATLAMAVVVVAWGTRLRRAAVAGGAAYVLVIAFSRLYLGVHNPSDIVAGWCLALAWVAALTLFFHLDDRFC